jgi:ectoine hydroxylase-related dioxygenase (phytanoyl-CoA dioxygenase family)
MAIEVEQKRQFDEKGYLIVRRFFDAQTMRRVSDWLDELAERGPDVGLDARYWEKSAITGEEVLVRAEHVLGDHNPDITRLLLCPRTIETLTALLGEPPVLFKEKANYKLPGGRADKLHQDQAAGWGRYADFFVTMAIVVDPNRKDNAALSVLCSGNYEKKLMGEEWQPLSLDDPPYRPEEEYLLVEADPGDVLFFDCYLPHGSPPNTSDRQRRNLYLTFNRQSAGDLRKRYYEEKWALYPPNQKGEARSESSYRV